MMSQNWRLCWLVLAVTFLASSSDGFVVVVRNTIGSIRRNNENCIQMTRQIQTQRKVSALSLQQEDSVVTPALSRRSLFSKIVTATISTTATLTVASSTSLIHGNNIVPPAFAADVADTSELESLLYKILRVREATQQERRLITTGKFKDIQRANVKLAIKFMVQNYRLGDAIVGAAAYLSGGNAQQMRAIDVGQTAVQNLQTILEYFDTSDVENIKVGSSAMGGKEELVLKGLEAAQLKLDEFLGFFDESIVKKVKAKVQEENDLNVKEFDKSLGDIINLPPPS